MGVGFSRVLYVLDLDVPSSVESPPRRRSKIVDTLAFIFGGRNPADRAIDEAWESDGDELEHRASLRDRLDAVLVNRGLATNDEEMHLTPSGSLMAYCTRLGLVVPRIDIQIEPTDLIDPYTQPGATIFACSKCHGPVPQLQSPFPGDERAIRLTECAQCGATLDEVLATWEREMQADFSVSLVADRHRVSSISLRAGCRDFVDAVESVLGPVSERFVPW